MLENFFFPSLQIIDIATEQTGLFFDRLSHKLEGMCKNMGKGAIFQRRKTNWSMLPRVAVPSGLS